MLGEAVISPSLFRLRKLARASLRLVLRAILGSRRAANAATWPDSEPPDLDAEASDELAQLLEEGRRRLRRIAILIVGSTVVIIGIAMIVLPGPAIVVIPAGLGILALEFMWARRMLVRLRRLARRFGKAAKFDRGRRSTKE